MDPVARIAAELQLVPKYCGECNARITLENLCIQDVECCIDCYRPYSVPSASAFGEQANFTPVETRPRKRRQDIRNARNVADVPPSTGRQGNGHTSLSIGSTGPRERVPEAQNEEEIPEQQPNAPNPGVAPVDNVVGMVYYRADNLYMDVIETVLDGNCLFDSLGINRQVLALISRSIYEFAQSDRLQLVVQFDGQDLLVPKSVAYRLKVALDESGNSFGIGAFDVIDRISDDGYYAQSSEEVEAMLFFSAILRIAAVLLQQVIEVYVEEPQFAGGVQEVQLHGYRQGNIDIDSSRFLPDARTSSVERGPLVKRILQVTNSDHFRLLRPTDAPVPVGSLPQSVPAGNVPQPGPSLSSPAAILLDACRHCKMKCFGKDKTISDLTPIEDVRVVNEVDPICAHVNSGETEKLVWRQFQSLPQSWKCKILEAAITAAYIYDTKVDFILCAGQDNIPDFRSKIGQFCKAMSNYLESRHQLKRGSGIQLLTYKYDKQQLSVSNENNTVAVYQSIGQIPALESSLDDSETPRLLLIDEADQLFSSLSGESENINQSSVSDLIRKRKYTGIISVTATGGCLGVVADRFTTDTGAFSSVDYKVVKANPNRLRELGYFGPENILWEVAHREGSLLANTSNQYGLNSPECLSSIRDWIGRDGKLFLDLCCLRIADGEDKSGPMGLCKCISTGCGNYATYMRCTTSKFWECFCTQCYDRKSSKMRRGMVQLSAQDKSYLRRFMGQGGVDSDQTDASEDNNYEGSVKCECGRPASYWFAKVCEKHKGEFATIPGYVRPLIPIPNLPFVGLVKRAAELCRRFGVVAISFNSGICHLNAPVAQREHVITLLETAVPQLREEHKKLVDKRQLSQAWNPQFVETTPEGCSDVATFQLTGFLIGEVVGLFEADLNTIRLILSMYTSANRQKSARATLRVPDGGAVFGTKVISRHQIWQMIGRFFGYVKDALLGLQLPVMQQRVVIEKAVTRFVHECMSPEERGPLPDIPFALVQGPNEDVVEFFYMGLLGSLHKKTWMFAWGQFEPRVFKWFPVVVHGDDYECEQAYQALMHYQVETEDYNQCPGEGQREMEFIQSRFKFTSKADSKSNRAFEVNHDVSLPVIASSCKRPFASTMQVSSRLTEIYQTLPRERNRATVGNSHALRVHRRRVLPEARPLFVEDEIGSEDTLSVDTGGEQESDDSFIDHTEEVMQEHNELEDSDVQDSLPAGRKRRISRIEDSDDEVEDGFNFSTNNFSDNFVLPACASTLREVFDVDMPADIISLYRRTGTYKVQYCASLCVRNIFMNCVHRGRDKVQTGMCQPGWGDFVLCESYMHGKRRFCEPGNYLPEHVDKAHQLLQRIGLLTICEERYSVNVSEFERVDFWAKVVDKISAAFLRNGYAEYSKQQ